MNFKRFWNRVLDILYPVAREVEREVERAERERIAIVERQQAEWRAAHPDLVAQGCPPPPTPESQTKYVIAGGPYGYP